MVTAVKLRQGVTGPSAPGSINYNNNNSNVLNLSRHVLDAAEEEVLQRGLFFVPTPYKVDCNILKRDFYEYHRRLKLLVYFDFDNNNMTREPFVESSHWEPDEGSVPETIKQFIEQDLRILEEPNIFNNKGQDNLSNEQRLALQTLAKNPDLVIKGADKGSKIVIMDKANYLLEANKQLDNKLHYRALTSSMQMETMGLIREVLNELYLKKFISFKQRTYLLGSDVPRPRKFYLLPKIHKDPEKWTIPHLVPPGRPIVSDCGSESYRIAEYIDYYLTPLSQRHPSYVKDTYEFVNMLKDVQVPAGSFLFSIDIDALYTNIDTRLGLRAVGDILNKYPDDKRPDAALLKLLEISLSRNDFEFYGKHYLQIHGTAMGKKFAPAYANIYMAEWERTVFPKCSKWPLLYKRYLDDIFGVWPYSKEDFLIFIDTLNTHHDTIKVKSNLQSEVIEFLDTQVYFFEEGPSRRLGTKVYFKPTDTHALLHRSSFHPRHTFRGIVKSQLIRFHRICTRSEDVQVATKVLFDVLKTRGYSRSFLRDIRVEVEQSVCVGARTDVQPNCNIVPFVSTFSHAAVNINKSIKDNFLELQSFIPELSEFKIISAYKRNKNLQDLLVHATLKDTNVKTRETRCDAHFTSLPFVRNEHTDQEAPVWGVFSLESSNIVYMIRCNLCNKVYVGQTKNKLKDRLKQHLYHINRGSTETELYAHFQGHDVIHLKILGLETKITWTTAQRFSREKYWIYRLDSCIPNGLNEKE